MNDKILVAGVGNIFLGDDAFGVEVVTRLSQMPLPDNVVVRDFGIRSYDLAYALMQDWNLVVLVDAVPAGSEPGTVYMIEPELPESGAGEDQLFDAHTMNPVAVLQLVSALGGKVGRMLVVGCEPATVESDEAGSVGLSAPVEAAVDEAIAVIREIVRNNSRATAA